MLASFWQWIVALLVWLAADPAEIDLEQPRAFAAVQVARATLRPDAPPSPAPTPADCDCGQTCVRGVWKPDGRVEQSCKCACPRCVAERAKGVPAAKCETGNCRVSSSAGR
jgi:hypothetical protein